MSLTSRTQYSPLNHSMSAARPPSTARANEAETFIFDLEGFVFWPTNLGCGLSSGLQGAIYVMWCWLLTQPLASNSGVCNVINFAKISRQAGAQVYRLLARFILPNSSEVRLKTNLQSTVMTTAYVQCRSVNIMYSVAVLTSCTVPQC
jgi:hypothetical protein